MFIGSAEVFRIRQIIHDLNNVVVSGRDSVLRFSVRAHVTSFPKWQENGGRFRLPEDKDFYSDVLLAAAMPEDDFPAFTTATAILLIDLLQSGEGTDKLFWNWDAFEGHYRMADPHVRAAIMNAFRVGLEIGSVGAEAPPSALDCLSFQRESVMRDLSRDGGAEWLYKAIETGVSPKEAGALWEANAIGASPLLLKGFRYLYERPQSMAPEQPETALLIPWS
jgi:hypothetical protein